MMQAPKSRSPPRPLRFVWQMDADMRLTISDEFAALAGAPTASMLGRPWPEIAAALDLDRDCNVARAIASHETFSGLIVAWPIGERHLMVELSGLPVFDRERAFRGYRGFGICREVAPTALAMDAGPRENVVALHAPLEAVALHAPPEAHAPHEAPSPALNAIEHNAFRELARRLTERLGEAVDAEIAAIEPPAETPRPVAEPAPAAAAMTDREAALLRELEAAQAELAEHKQRADELARTRSAAEDARRAAEQGSAAKSEFVARISHEIRNPLNAILGFSEIMMQERFGPVGNERYRQYLKDIFSCGEHLIALVNDLLDLSKIEAGKLELAFTGVDLNELTQACVALMAPQAARERIIVRSALAPKLPAVIADARAVRQIVLNLLSNAIKFTGAGGQVIVSTSIVSTSIVSTSMVSTAHADDGAVVLRVRDTGAGMTAQELAAALEPFRQLATSPKKGGTGLGLPLTKALAEANRATFAISSSPGAGTLVEVTFAAARVAAE